MTVVFDMDGTLVDSMRIWKSAANEYILSKGLTPSDDLLSKIYGTTLKYSSNIIAEEYFPEKTGEDIYGEITDWIVEKYKDATPKPGAVEFVKKLKQMGITTVVASASNDKMVLTVLKRLGFTPYLDKIFTATNKTTEKVYLEIADELSVSPCDCWMVEDALFSMKSAKKAGYKVLGVHDKTNETKTEEIKSVSDLYITTMVNTESIIKSMGL